MTRPRVAFDATEDAMRGSHAVDFGLFATEPAATSSGGVMQPQILGPRPGAGAAPTNTDCAWLLAFLSDGAVHSLTAILRASFHQRGHGLTVHSRVAELRGEGHTITWKKVAGAKRGESSTYQLREKR